MSQKSLHGTQTEKNLLTAFAGESQARNRYTYFASKAKNEGYVQISHIFEETANQEKEHAKRFFKFLEGGEAMVQYAFPAGIIGSTRDNLIAAADGERHEHMDMYPGYAEVAMSESFPEIALVFRKVSVAEQFHERRYRELAENIDKGRVFRRPEKVVWRCRNCGYLHEDFGAPDLCPACAHPQAHFELLKVNW